MKRITPLSAIGGWMLIGLVGCSPKPPEPAGTIAVAASPLFGADVAATALQAGFEVLPAADNMDFGHIGLDAVVLPASDRLLVRSAQSAGVPVFTIGLDNRGGGRMAAEVIHEALHGKGNVAILDYPDDTAAILRTQGFQERLGQLNSRIQVVAQLPGGQDPQQAVIATQTILQAQGELAGIFAVNPTAARGAREAWTQRGGAGDLVLVAVCESPQPIAGLSLVPVTDNVASNTLDAIRASMAGGTVKTEILVPMKLVRSRLTP